jgi:hypothetical protein
MTAQILASELGNLIQESKRKHSDLRNVSLTSHNPVLMDERKLIL